MIKFGGETGLPPGIEEFTSKKSEASGIGGSEKPKVEEVEFTIGGNEEGAEFSFGDEDEGSGFTFGESEPIKPKKSPEIIAAEEEWVRVREAAEDRAQELLSDFRTKANEFTQSVVADVEDLKDKKEFTALDKERAREAAKKFNDHRHSLLKEGNKLLDSLVANEPDGDAKWELIREVGSNLSEITGRCLDTESALYKNFDFSRVTGESGMISATMISEELSLARTFALALDKSHQYSDRVAQKISLNKDQTPAETAYGAMVGILERYGLGEVIGGRDHPATRVFDESAIELLRGVEEAKRDGGPNLQSEWNDMIKKAENALESYKTMEILNT